MKNFTLSKIVFSAFFVLLGATTTFGQFTATTSGPWNDANTWGGTAPDYNLGLLETVTIPNGIDVTLDNVLQVDGIGASLTVQGSLTGSNGQGDLIINSGTVSGDGEITLDNMVFSGGTFSFTGEIQTLTATSSNGLILGAELNVVEKFTLSSGTLSVVNGGEFEISTNGVIVINSGSLQVNGGAISLTNVYDVQYSQGSSTSGFEMDGPGLRHLTIDVGQANAVTFDSDIDVDGTLLLESGTMILNGNDLTVNGTVSSAGTGAIQSTENSDITFNTTSGTNGVLRFTLTGNEVDNFIINVGNNNWVSLGSDLIVHGNLEFTSGRLNADDNNVIIEQTGAVTGYDSSSYVMTNNGGTLSMHLSSGGNSFVTFPVGTADHFMPAGIQLTSGSTSAMMEVGVDEGVFSGGVSGNDWSTDSAVVNSTWFIEPEASATGVEANIRFMWSTGMEVNGFDNTNAYVGHYNNSQWEMASNVGSSPIVNGMWSLVAAGIIDFSPFAIFSEVEMSIHETASNIALDIYPNPTAERINIDFASDISGVINMEIVDAQGRVMNNYKLTGNETSISVNHLPAGNYFVRFFNSDFTVVKKIVKL